MTDLHYVDASTALAHFRSRTLSPVELMQAVISRTEALNPFINAFTETLFAEALTAARSAEAMYRQGGDVPVLLGVPVAAKEKHGIRGRTLSQGLVAHQDAITNASHPVIERIQQAGGIIHARTTTPEYSCATVTHSPLWGVTRNPWNTRYSPGGSSGGSAAAVAAGFSTLATASDIAGSTRLPASFTGIVGFKAPYGRIPGLAPLSADHSLPRRRPAGTDGGGYGPAGHCDVSARRRRSRFAGSAVNAAGQLRSRRGNADCAVPAAG